MEATSKSNDFDWVARSTLGELLERAAGFERGVRFVDRREHATYFTYAELYRRAQRVAKALRHAGVVAGDRVALVLPTGPAFYDAFFGAILAGAVPVPVYPPIRLGRLDEYHRRTGEMIRSVRARLVISDRGIRRILGVTLDLAHAELGCMTADALLDADLADTAPLVERGSDDIAFIQMSSGTTRAPKPICLTHRQVLSNVALILEGMFVNYPETEHLTHAGVSWLPLYHDMGLVGCVLTALAKPGDLTLIPPELFVARPAVWLRTISQYRGTVSAAPNFAYALCVERIDSDELRGVDLSSWRIALNGSESVMPATLQRFIDRFTKYGLRSEALTPVYGLAEATLAVTFSDVREPFRWNRFDHDKLTIEGKAETSGDGLALVSLGRPLPGFHVRIVDANGTELAAGRCGRVFVQGPSLMQGYHGMPLETQDTLRGGWLDTGDRGFVHEGELYLYGRDKDIIILRGRNHAPQEFEHVLDDVEGVRAGCVAAIGVVPSGAEAEQLVILVERSRQLMAEDRADEAIAERVRRQLLVRLGAAPDHVRVLEPGTLPRTSSGKIRRSEAKGRYLAETLTPPRPVTALRMVGAFIRSGIGLAKARRAFSQDS